MKKVYKKPSFRIVELHHKTQLLAGSGDPVRNVPWWDGEGDAPEFNWVDKADQFGGRDI